MTDLARAAARMFCVGFAGTSVPAETRALIGRGVRAAILFKRNFESAQQIAELCGELKRQAGGPFLNCIDQEGGRVVRLGEPFTQVPSMRAVGETGDAGLARRVGAVLGKELRAANIDMNLSPVLDVDTNPENPVIGDRSFGRMPARVTEMGLALIAGLQGQGVAACGKHFPGHGDTAQDSHLHLPRLGHAIERLREIELPPFAAAARAGVAAIMTAHVIFEAIDPAVPATMSRAVLTGLLREELGFGGVIVSDDLEMKAIANHYPLDEVIVRGVNAGVDLFAICHSAALQNEAIDLLIKAVERGEVARERIEDAGRRLDRLHAAYVRPAWSGEAAVIGCAEHRRVVDQMAREEGKRDPTVYERGSG